MLPPVVPLPNSQISYQDQRPSFDFSNSGQMNQAATSTAMTSGLEQSAAVAGRLNILLLSGRERMAQNLAMVAEIFGAAIGVVRKQGESTASFAARLADAIAALPLDQRLKLEGQLARALSGAQLRMLLAAFKDPGGPDAAKLSMLIELSRGKEGDLAARSVVTSYRQNAGELRADALPERAAASAAVPVAEQATEPPADSAESHPIEVKAAADGETAIDESALKEKAQNDAADTPEDVSRSAKPEAAAKEDDGEEAPDAGEHDSMPEQDLTPATANERGARAGDARSLQAALVREFDTAEAADAGRIATSPSTDNEKSATRPADALDEAGGDSIDRMRNAFKALIGEVLLEASGQEEPQRSHEPSQTMLTLKGWREVNNLYPHIVAATVQESDEAMMADALRAVNGDDADQADKPGGKSGEPSIEERARHAAAAVAIADQGGAGNAVAEARSGRSFPEALLSQWQLLDEQAVAGRSALAAPAAQAPPLALANYLFSRDEDEATEASPPERGQQGSSDPDTGEEQQSAADEEASNEEVDASDSSSDTGESPEPMTAHLTQMPEADRANDLYWRMAGWS